MSNLALYQKIVELKNCLELRAEKGIGMSIKDINLSIELVNKIFGLIERRKG